VHALVRRQAGGYHPFQPRRSPRRLTWTSRRSWNDHDNVKPVNARDPRLAPECLAEGARSLPVARSEASCRSSIRLIEGTATVLVNPNRLSAAGRGARERVRQSIVAVDRTRGRQSRVPVLHHDEGARPK